MATVLDIVKAYLVDHGYDGLFSPGDCACRVDDLAPCGQMRGDCQVGYLCECICEDHEWHIGPEKTDVVDVCSG